MEGGSGGQDHGVSEGFWPKVALFRKKPGRDTYRGLYTLVCERTSCVKIKIYCPCVHWFLKIIQQTTLMKCSINLPKSNSQWRNHEIQQKQTFFFNLKDTCSCEYIPSTNSSGSVLLLPLGTTGYFINYMKVTNTSNNYSWNNNVLILALIISCWSAKIVELAVNCTGYEINSGKYTWELFSISSIILSCCWAMASVAEWTRW